jgi:hypothetical protein
MEFYSATKQNEILSFAGKWMKLDNNVLSDVTQVENTKSTCFLLYMECRPNTNTVILWKTSHAKGRSQEVKKVNMVDLLPI